MADAAALGLSLAKALSLIVNAQNAEIIRQYNMDVAAYKATFGTSPDASAPAPPKLPMLTKINTDLVSSLEIQFDALESTKQGEAAAILDWTSIYSQVPYDPTPTPPTPPPVETGPTGPGKWVQTPFGKEWVPAS